MSILEDFEQYLKGKGYKVVTAKGTPSTVPDYVGRVRKVAENEGITVEELAKKINDILPDYLWGGNKEHEGCKSHRAVSNALRRFKEFLDVQK